ncbi:fumarate reductase/succinate dehydrogenase flavoprotein subunit [Schaalia suimastitidis]|uniref:fumarate reductase/succinate dehydrogenase flavoprotein subunit n=1 Tax=Schaalia suimastitidis TaxID=121163 RepID=UPI00040E204E|nr:fumarate reductase/succinate dehydrogenase flavoprotein subunit [Schaalia suimastitidis]
MPTPQIRQGHALDAREPQCAPENAWEHYIANAKLVSPGNRKRFTIVVVGTGLAGAGAAAALAELGYTVDVITFHDTPRRAHSVAAQGGINAARARRVDGDTLERFVRDTLKGGDFRARESEAWRLGAESSRVIDHMNALGVPFAREYAGSLSTRSFGGVQVSRTYYSRGQTGQQLQVATSSALMRQVGQGRIRLWVRHEMLDLVTKDGCAVGVVTRDLRTGTIQFHPGHAVILATGGYGNIYFHSTLAKNSNATAAWRCHRAGAYMASPSLIQFHPTALPVSSPWQSKTTLMSESLRNDGRIWVPRQTGDTRQAADIPDSERDYYLERLYPAFGNLTPRDIASRAAYAQIQAGNGVGPLKNSVYLDFRDAIERLGTTIIAERYGNLFAMYHDATGEDPYIQPMRIAPGAHFTMGGLWVDYDLMTSIPGLFVAGEANAAYHGANRLGANSLLAACVDGSFTLPRTVPNYLATLLGQPLITQDHPAALAAITRVRHRLDRLRSINGDTPAKVFHRELGRILYRDCGVVRNKEGLLRGINDIADLRHAFYDTLRVSGTNDEYNPDLVEAGRVADYLELAQLMCVDALHREESCGAHFRSEYQSDGEAQRDDERWQCVSAWESQAWDQDPILTHHREELTYRSVTVATRSYQ